MAHQRAYIIVFALAALVCRCHAAVIIESMATADEASANTGAGTPVPASASAVPAAAGGAAAASAATSKNPTCPPLDVVIVNPVDISFSRDCILTYLARAFSKDLNPVNKKAITYAVDNLDRALKQIRVLNSQMHACDNAVVSAMAVRDLENAQLMSLTPGEMLPPPPPLMRDDDVPPPPQQRSLADGQRQTGPLIGQAVVLPPGSSIVLPTAAVSAAAAEQAVAAKNSKNA